MRSAMPLSPDLPSWSRTETILSALPPTVARVAKPPARVAACAARSAMLVLPLAMLLPRSSIFCAAMDAAVSRRPANWSASLPVAVVVWSMMGMSLPPTLVAALRSGVSNCSPSRPMAALTLPTMPSKLSPAFLAAPPMCSFMAASKSAKLTLPSETMSLAASVVVWKWSARYCRTGMPEPMSWSMSSPCSLPFAATWEKIRPMSWKLRPLIWAASPTVVSTPSRSPPCLMPDATSVAATLAASPSPKAVPLTEASALPMILSTLAVSYLRALSLVWARSMLSARSKPPFAVRPAMPDAMPAMVPTPTLPILPNAPPMVEMMLLPLFWVPVAVPALMEPSMALPRPLVLGLMMM